MRDIEAKTMLTDGQYDAMMRVIDAKGMTQAGYIRHLILQDIAGSQDYVALISAVTASPTTCRKPPENGVVLVKKGGKAG